MENASKALIMAAGILIAIILIALLARTYTTVSIFQRTQLSERETQELLEFNQEYLKYLNEYVYGTEVITVINKALGNTRHKISVNIKFIGGYTYKGYAWDPEERSYKEIQVQIGPKEEVEIENNVELDKDMQNFISSLEETEINTMAFKCTNVGYDSSGRVNSIRFEEKQWGDLY